LKLPNAPQDGWLIEHGIGESRALLIDQDEVLAAKLHFEGETYAGKVANATLISKTSGANRGTAQLTDGTDVLLARLPRDLTEGQSVPVKITRTKMAERGRFKLAQARCLRPEELARAEREDEGPLPQGQIIRRFPTGLWEEVWSAASSGSLPFTGGEILIDPAPAMTLIDIDCSYPEGAYNNAIPTIVRALRWFDMGGNIGIDFPTLEAKKDRKAVDAAFAEALNEWPHERTAMNGFGFVQIVASLKGPSLLHRFAASRVGMCARFALRIGEMAQGHGPVLLLTVHPALQAKLKPTWLEELARRTGKQVRIESNPKLALEAPQAQIVAE
jgi:hypothetical protein